MLSREDNELIARTGPGTAMGNLLRRYWLPAMLSKELPAPDGPPVRLKLLNETLVAYRDTSGRVGILDAYCPHRGANLFWGRNERDGLRCVYHGWKFDVSGTCVDMPSEPAASNFRNKIRTTAYPTQEAAGIVWAYLGPKELAPELPQLEWMSLPKGHVYVQKRIQHCNYLQSLEGEIDSAHVSFLHSAFKPKRRVSLRGQRLLESTRDSAPRFNVHETEYGLLIGAQRRTKENSDYWRITQFLMPSYTMVPAEPGNLINFTAAIPMDDENMWGFTVGWRPDRPLSHEEIADFESGEGVYAELIPGTFETVMNRSNDFGIDREKQRTETFTGIRGVREQDIPVQEDQWGPISDRTREHLGTTDLAIIAMRKRLLREAKQLPNGTEPPAPHAGASYRVRSAAFVTATNDPWYDHPEIRDWMHART